MPAEETIRCDRCQRPLWSGPEGEGPPSIAGPVDGRTPCPQCRSTSRRFARELHDEVKIEASVSAEVTRALNGVRLTLLTALIGVGASVGLSAGFGVESALLGVGAGIVAVALLSLALWHHGTRQALLGFADKILHGQRPAP